MFYVVAEGKDISYYNVMVGDYRQAKAMAEDLKKSQGVDFFIVKAETVWSTITLEELDNG